MFDSTDPKPPPASCRSSLKCISPPPRPSLSQSLVCKLWLTEDGCPQWTTSTVSSPSAPQLPVPFSSPHDPSGRFLMAVAASWLQLSPLLNQDRAVKKQILFITKLSNIFLFLPRFSSSLHLVEWATRKVSEGEANNIFKSGKLAAWCHRFKKSSKEEDTEAFSEEQIYVSLTVYMFAKLTLPIGWLAWRMRLSSSQHSAKVETISHDHIQFKESCLNILIDAGRCNFYFQRINSRKTAILCSLKGVGSL